MIGFISRQWADISPLDLWPKTCSSLESKRGELTLLSPPLPLRGEKGQQGRKYQEFKSSLLDGGCVRKYNLALYVKTRILLFKVVEGALSA